MIKIKVLFYYDGYEEEVEVEINEGMFFQEYYPIVEKSFQKWLETKPESYMNSPSWCVI